MRIVAGTFRSRVIAAVEGQSTRPTTDKIREAIFSRIGPYFDGGEMLDLFAGSGAMSLEAISRGMGHCVLVDCNFKAISTIKQNMKTLGLNKECEVIKCDYKSALQRFVNEQRVFDLVFLDPPYLKQQITNILQFLDEHQLVADGGDVICESLKEDEFPQQVGKFEKLKEVTYGITKVTYYTRRVNE